MLAVHYHRFLPRDVLIDWLWERDDATEHTTQFFVIVHELRRLLAGSETERAHPVIIRDGDRYQLTLGSDVWLDLAEFDRLLEIARRADTAGDRLSAIDAYSRAVDLYRDDLLADEPYAEWCWMERERRREQCIAALRQLARAWSAMGQWDSSIVALRRALELDRFREDIHRELMRALWAAGRRAKAIRQFAECARLLRQELGMEPDPETFALLDQIRRSPHSS
ncbi:Transcriptional regulatory protein MoaR1 [bacterium HR27]|nr:Transcriptional regulatory protein MoaR1 [bacterium HR27]